MSENPTASNAPPPAADLWLWCSYDHPASPVGRLLVYVCERCSAVVVDSYAHRQFHTTADGAAS